MKPKFSLRHFILLASSVCFATSSLQAADGTWITVTGTSNWSTSGNWSGGTIADGSGSTANFTTGFTGTTTATLDTSRSIGHIIKDDNVGGVNQLNIGVSGGSILTMATGGAGAPTITNSDAGPGGRLEIAAQLTGSEGLTKLGVGVVNLNNNNSNWSGTTTISEGTLNMGAINLANIGGGSGRNISVAAGAAVSFNGLSNAHLNRIVETSGEFTVMTNGGGNNLDFTNSATGANLSGAFLGNYSNVGGKAEVTGIITMAGNYRLGAVNGLQNGTLGITQTSLLSGSNGLIIGGNRVVIVGAHTFTGDTVVRDGARLGLSGLNTDAVGVRNNSFALQNSVLDLGATTATGQIFLEGGVGGGIAGFTTQANGGTTSATFGGLKGSRDLNAAFLFTDGGNNVSSTAATAITGFTLNVGTGVTASYSGAIGGFGADASGATGGASTLTKTGLGTQVFEGAHTYTGATSINEGTLILNGSTAAGSAVSVASGATLGGVGTVNGTLDVTGIIAPGNNDISTLTVNNNVTWNGAASASSATNWKFELGTGDTADLLDITGDFTKGTGSVFQFDFLGSAVAGVFDLVSWSGTTDFVAGDFSYTGLDPLYTGSFSFSLDGSTLQFTSSVIPEPSTALAGILLGLGLLRRRRSA